MARVLCPKCDTKVKIPDDYEKPFIRCSSCGKKIQLDDDDDRPAPRPQQEEASSSGLGGCALIFAYVGAVLAALVCIAIAFFQPGVAMLVAVLFGLFFSIFAAVGWLVAKFSAIARGSKRRFKDMVPWLGLTLLSALLFFVTPLALHAIGKQAGWFRPPADEGRGDGLVKGPEVGNAPKKDNEPDKKEPPKFEKRPLKMSGDAALDKALAELAADDGKRFRAALATLNDVAVNEHRDVVAQHLAAQLSIAPVWKREHLMRALGRWGTAEEVPLLIQMLADNDINTRNEALQALGKLKDERAAAPMVRCLLDLQTQYHAEQALKAMGPVAEKEVLAMLKQNKKTQDKIIAIRILAEIGTEQSVPDLEAASQSVELQSVSRTALAAINARGKK